MSEPSWQKKIELHKEVPKDLRENLRFRKKLLERATNNPAVQRGLIEACSRDPLFWINCFAFTFDPRLVGTGKKTVVPFVTWDFQDEAFTAMNAACGREDVFIEKSRDMGASWMLCMLFLYRWLFRDMESFLLVSRKEELVDKAGDPKSLFWKVDFVLKRLPKWMKPRYTRNKLALHNDDNGSTIDGESTNTDVARGDRRTAIGLDEFASVENGHEVLAATGDATNSRFFNSTPKGTGNAFYTQRGKTKNRIRMHWSQHPEKRKGLYASDRVGDSNVLRIIDKGYKFPAGYKFITDGKIRSVWYDAECERRSHKLEVAQELDIDYLGSAYTFFDPETTQTWMNRDARPPLVTGDLAFDPFQCVPNRFEAAKGDELGPFRMWTPIIEGFPPPEDYVVGADIGMGTGASNSVLSAWNRRTGVKVACYATPYLRPEEFGRLAVALCRWFRNIEGGPAFLIHEANGPGRAFGSTVVAAGFLNIYFAKTKEGSLDQKESLTPGWHSTTETKQVLLGDYRQMLKDSFATNVERESFQEMMEYVVNTDRSITHSSASNAVDPSGAKDNHGDRVIADALACKFIKERPAIREAAATTTYPPGSYGHRRQEWEAQQRKQKGW